MSRRILKTLALALVLGGVFAGSAVAMRIAEPSIYSVSTSHAIVSEKVAGLTAVVPPAHVILSDRGVASDKVGLPTQSPTVVASNGNGFDWSDAGIASALTFAALLALSAAALGLRRHRPLAH
jgi:hypothetical protein